MENADSRKAAKAERKAAKNQVLFDVITQEELAMVERALHPESEQQASTVSKGQGLADNSTIDENIAFNPNTSKWDKLRQGVHAKKMTKNNGGKPKPNTPQQDNEILSPIFASLGTGTNLSKVNKERKSLDARLRVAILGYLVAFENDQVETMQRMAGYWRYANRKIYNDMVRNNELWDWATGEKLPEIREELELDVIEEEDENAEAGTLDGDTEGQIPENWDDPDFELPAGQTTLSLTPLVDRSNTKGTVDRSDTASKLDQEIKSIRDLITNIHIPKRSFSPGRLPSQNLTSKVPSPFSINQDRERRLDEPEDLTKAGSDVLKGNPKPRIPLSPSTPNGKGQHEKGFQGIKDTRIFGKAIRKASPPSKHTPRTPQPIKSLLAPTTQNRDPPGCFLNRFRALNHETPAPCDEVQMAAPPVVKPVLRLPARSIVRTLAIHDERDNWTTQQRLKGKKKGARGGGSAVALREQAAVNVHAKKFAGGKSFAAVVRRGL